MAGLADKTLILMRHGKSDWRVDEGSFLQDIDRPLSARGLRDTNLMAVWLGEQLAESVNIISSPARRALETAEIIRKGLRVSSFEVVPEVYLAEASTLRAIAREAALSKLLIVGHNPGMEEFVESLWPKTGKTVEYAKLMPTGAVYAFEMPGDGSPDRMPRLLFHQRPKHLR